MRRRAATTAHRLEQLLAEKDRWLRHWPNAADLPAARDRLQELELAGAPTVDRTQLHALLTRQEQARQAHHETGLNARSAHERHASLQAKHAELVEQAQQAREAVEAAARRRVQREHALVRWPDWKNSRAGQRPWWNRTPPPPRVAP